jgi:CubicO group peptidase (beta-lactamase class C family)
MRGGHRFIAAVTVVLCLVSLVASADQPTSRELVGLWAARRSFGPQVRGDLTITRDGKSWTAEIAGRRATPTVDGATIVFTLPESKGSFRGRLENDHIRGHWIQPRSENLVAYATPVVLEKLKENAWRGVVAPLDDQITLYLPVRRKEDGTLGVFLENPERNAGRYLRVERLAVEGGKVKLFGGKPETVLAEGGYNAANKTLSIALPSQGGNYDFQRASSEDEAGFFPRGKPPQPFMYRPPTAGDDGWPVASLEDVGLSQDAIRRFVQMLIHTPIDSFEAPEIHAVLIARHGKLVLEEYFHGFDGQQVHDTRSASKSLTAILAGAAIMHGEPVSTSTPVYRAMGRSSADLDPRKEAIALEHLLTMSSGLDCDDNDGKSVGNENTMQNQSEQPDWYRYTLDLKMVRAPGEKSVYGSASPNLAGGVLARTTGRWLPELFADYVAEPLGIRRYAMNLTPTGDAYMGGGVRLRARDFLKISQAMMDGGRWHGRQVVTGEWARKSTSPLVKIQDRDYGYLWWVQDYPYQGRTVRAFFAGGNGGQIAMAIPELDLAIAFFGGNYGSRATFTAQRSYVPEHILPAVH